MQVFAARNLRGGLIAAPPSPTSERELHAFGRLLLHCKHNSLPTGVETPPRTLPSSQV